MRSSSSPFFCFVAFAAFFLAVSHAFLTQAPLRPSSSLCQSRQPARIVVSMADGEGETKPKGKGWVRVGWGGRTVGGVRTRLLVVRPMKLCTVRRHKHWRSLSPRKQQRGSFAEGLGAEPFARDHIVSLAYQQAHF